MGLPDTLGFAAIGLALAPVAVAGYLVSALRIGWASRRDKALVTAASLLGVCWILHERRRRAAPAAALLHPEGRDRDAAARRHY